MIHQLDGDALMFNDDLAFAPAKAMGRILIVYQGPEFGAKLRLKDGSELVIWDERPNRQPSRRSGRIESDQRIEDTGFGGVDVLVAVSFAEQIYQFMETVFGAVSEMTDAEFKDSVATLTLYVNGGTAGRYVLGYELHGRSLKGPQARPVGVEPTQAWPR